ncbi:hypothetical protein ABK040_009153 [Willaertia magna]
MGNAASFESVMESTAEGQELRNLGELKGHEYPFVSKITDFVEYIEKGQAEGFKTIIEKLNHIKQIHYDITASKSNSKINDLSYVSEISSMSNNILFGSSSSSSPQMKSAFEMLTENFSKQIDQFKSQLKSLTESNNAGQSTNNSIIQNPTSSGSEKEKRKSFKRASSFKGLGTTNNLTNGVIVDFGSLLQSAFDWTAVDDKQGYFKIRDRMEIVISHYFEELKDMKEILKKCEGHDRIDVTLLFTGSFEREFWVKNFGQQVFYVQKDTLLNDLDSLFLTYKGLKSKTWVDDIDFIIDPTCDDIVSISDFKTIIQWFGPFGDLFVVMEDLLRMKCFWGSLTSITAQELLSDQPTGTFIIRFCEDRPGDFYISCVEEEENDDSINFFDSQMNSQSSRFVYHFLLQRKREKKEKKEDKGKIYFLLTDADMEYKFETVDQIIRQYNLTFKIPFEGESPLRVDLNAKNDMKVIRDSDEEIVLDNFIKYTGRVESEKEKKKKAMALNNNNTNNMELKINALTKNLDKSNSSTPSSSTNTSTTNSPLITSSNVDNNAPIINISIPTANINNSATSTVNINQKNNEKQTSKTTVSHLKTDSIESPVINTNGFTNIPIITTSVSTPVVNTGSDSSTTPFMPNLQPHDHNDSETDSENDIKLIEEK